MSQKEIDFPYYLNKEEYPGLKLVRDPNNDTVSLSLSCVAHTGVSRDIKKSLGIKYNAEFNPDDYHDALLDHWKDNKDVNLTQTRGCYNLAEIEKWLPEEEDKETLYDIAGNLDILASKAKMYYDAQAPKFVT